MAILGYIRLYEYENGKENGHCYVPYGRRSELRVLGLRSYFGANYRVQGF